PAFVRRLCAGGVDVLGERHAALERAVLDLHLPVRDAAPVRRPRADAAERDRALRDLDRDLLGLDAGEVDEDRHRRRVVRTDAVDPRTQAPPEPGEARNLPQIGEELLELLVHPIDVTSLVHGSLGYPWGPGRELPDMLETWTRTVIRLRWPIAVAWL